MTRLCTLAFCSLFLCISSLLAQPCPPGQFSATGSSPCSVCPAGTFNNLPGQTSCSDCSPGRFQSDSEGSTCNDCDAGTYQPSSGQSTCLDCAVGTFNNAFGAIACVDCDPGSSSEEGGTACFACPEGQFTANGGEACMECSKGTYADSQGSNSCTDCAAGTYSDTLGSSSCSACDPGTFAGSAGQEACDDCPAGTFTAASASSVCSACPAGTFSASAATECLNCPIGSAQPSTGSASCDACGALTYSFEVGAASCLSCKALVKTTRVNLKGIDGEDSDRSDRLAIITSFALTPDEYAQWDPLTTGLWILIEDADQSKVVALQAESGEFSDGTQIGWAVKERKRGNTWIYRDKNAEPSYGISLLRISGQRRCGRKTCRLRIQTRGSTGEYQFDANTARLSLILGYGAGDDTRCFRTNFSDRTCRFRRNRKQVLCKLR